MTEEEFPEVIIKCKELTDKIEDLESNIQDDEEQIETMEKRLSEIIRLAHDAWEIGEDIGYYRQEIKELDSKLITYRDGLVILKEALAVSEVEIKPYMKEAVDLGYEYVSGFIPNPSSVIFPLWGKYWRKNKQSVGPEITIAIESVESFEYNDNIGDYNEKPQ